MALIGARFDISVTDTRRRAARRFLYPYLVRDRMLLMERGVHLAYASCLRLHCFPFIIAALRTLMRRPRPSICFSLFLSSFPLFYFSWPSVTRSLAVHWVKCGYEHHYIFFVCIYFLSPHAHSYVFVPVGRFFFFSFFSLIFFSLPSLYSPSTARYSLFEPSTMVLPRFISVVPPSLGRLLLFFYRGKSSRSPGESHLLSAHSG